ncbi:MAG: zinc metallopeptidase [Clostridia bacterium]
MEEYICLGACIITIILFKFIFKINIKKAKSLEENKKMQTVTDKFPENIEIAKEMLEMLDNKDVKIEEAKDTKTSLYIAITNKISIADLKDNYARIQTIAHECIHSVQDRTVLMFNFIFSNISILYFAIVTILTICGIIKNSIFQIFILTLLAFIQFSVRAFLEIDAMTKSKYLAKEYMEKKNLCAKEEIDTLINEYDKINKIGIPFVTDNLITNALIRISVYILIAIIS